MEAKDLRIGNLVSKNIASGNGRTIVSKLGCQDIVRIHEKIGSFNYNPITLTEEWLIKLGFNNDYKEGYIGIDCEHTDFVLTKPFVMGEWQEYFSFQYEAGGRFLYCKIQYLHQLQNFFFSIAGKELVLKHGT